MFRHAPAVEIGEPPQAIAVGDPFAQFAIVPVLDPLQGERAQHLLGAQPVSSRGGVLQTALKILAHDLDQFGMPVDEVGNGLQHGIELHVLVQELQIGKADLGIGRSGHFFAL